MPFLYAAISMSWVISLWDTNIHNFYTFHFCLCYFNIGNIQRGGCLNFLVFKIYKIVNVSPRSHRLTSQSPTPRVRDTVHLLLSVPCGSKLLVMLHWNCATGDLFLILFNKQVLITNDFFPEYISNISLVQLLPFLPCCVFYLASL